MSDDKHNFNFIDNVQCSYSYSNGYQSGWVTLMMKNIKGKKEKKEKNKQYDYLTLTYFHVSHIQEKKGNVIKSYFMIKTETNNTFKMHKKIATTKFSME